MNIQTRFTVINEQESIDHKLKRITSQLEFQRKNSLKYSSLTYREIEVVKLLANDYNNPQIAIALCISRSTVEQHRKHINKKLGTNTLSQIIKYALAFDLI